MAEQEKEGALDQKSEAPKILITETEFLNCKQAGGLALNVFFDWIFKKVKEIYVWTSQNLDIKKRHHVCISKTNTDSNLQV